MKTDTTTWLRMGPLRQRFPLPVANIRELADQGLVRRMKLGDTPQARTAYAAEDLAKWMDAKAKGEKDD